MLFITECGSHTKPILFPDWPSHCARWLHQGVSARREAPWGHLGDYHPVPVPILEMGNGSSDSPRHLAGSSGGWSADPLPLQDADALDLEMLAPYISMDDDFQLTSSEQLPRARQRPAGAIRRPRARSFHGLSPPTPEPTLLPRWGSDPRLSCSSPSRGDPSAPSPVTGARKR